MNCDSTRLFLFNEFGFVSWFLFAVDEKSGRNDAVARQAKFGQLRNFSFFGWSRQLRKAEVIAEAYNTRIGKFNLRCEFCGPADVLSKQHYPIFFISSLG